jgi:hypothetical protein
MIQPFRIDVAEGALADLRDRIERTRWPDEIAGSGWDYGTNRHYLRELLAYWRDRFDWREQERHLNAFSHFLTDVDGLTIHYVREPGRGPSPMPFLLLHGWPSTFYEMS